MNKISYFHPKCIIHQKKKGSHTTRLEKRNRWYENSLLNVDTLSVSYPSSSLISLKLRDLLMSLTISFKLSLIPITQTQDYAPRGLLKESKSFFLLSSISFISKVCLNPHKELPQAVDEAIKSSYLYSPIIKIIFPIQWT